MRRATLRPDCRIAGPQASRLLKPCLRPVRFVRGAEPAHAERAMDALGRLHASRRGQVSAFVIPLALLALAGEGVLFTVSTGTSSHVAYLSLETGEVRTVVREGTIVGLLTPADVFGSHVDDAEWLNQHLRSYVTSGTY